MKRFFVNTLFFLALLLFVACKVEMPEGVIEPDKMEDIIYDYHLVQVMTTDQMATSYERKLHINYVFEKHGVTKAMFDSSMVWYTRYPKKMVRIYANLEERVTQELESMGDGAAMVADVINQEKMLADTVELWRGGRVRLLSSSPLNNRIAFNFTADTTYVKGDSIRLAFTAKHLRGDMEGLRHFAHAALVVEYGDDSSVSTGVTLAGDSTYLLAVERNYDADIKSLHGFLYYSDNDTLCASKLLLGDISLKRIHPEEE